MRVTYQSDRLYKFVAHFYIDDLSKKGEREVKKRVSGLFRELRHQERVNLWLSHWLKRKKIDLKKKGRK
jgi:hypothetical protein